MIDDLAVWGVLTRLDPAGTVDALVGDTDESLVGIVEPRARDRQRRRSRVHGTNSPPSRAPHRNAANWESP